MLYTGYPQQRASESFMYAVYAWMAAALSITAVVAYAVATSPHLVRTLYTNPFLLFGIFIGQIILVTLLSGAVANLGFVPSLVVFFGYAGLVGLTLSAIFYIYTLASIGTAFITTAAMFGGMALYGYFTKTDLTTMGNRAIMVLWGLIVAIVVNMFFHNAVLDLIISVVGVILFSLLTAYDTQKIKQIAREMVTDDETMHVIALRGALILYLDFINLFVYLMRFIGKPRNE